MFSERAFRDKLANAANAGDLLALFEGWQPAG